MRKLEGKVAVVTGGASGIGLATARELKKMGASVAIGDRNGELAVEVARDLCREGTSVKGFGLDVADRASCDSFSNSVRGSFGPVNILANIAGIAGRARLGDSDSAAQWDAVMSVNLTGTYNTTISFLEDLKLTRGVIINMSSIVGFTSGFAQAGYVASKGGVKSLTQAMCRELSGFGIRVNAVAPGIIETPLTSADDSEFEEWLRFHCPMNRFGRPEEVAKAIGFLSSDDASFITGVTLPIDGGYLAI